MQNIYSIVFLAAVLLQPPESGWDVFARVKFSEKFFKELKEYYLVPLMDSRIRAYEGKEFTLQGYYLPMELEKNTIIISRNPYAQCFFCGGAGPESVAEIIFETRQSKFKTDQLITVTGILKLNESDVNHLNFIITKARIIKQ